VCRGSFVCRRRSTAKAWTRPRSPRRPRSVAPCFPQWFGFRPLEVLLQKSLYRSTIEPATPSSRSFEPTMHCVPCDLFDSSDGGLVGSFNAESRHFIEGSTTVLESMIRSSGCRAERLPTSLTLVATTLAPPSPIEAMANDSPCTAVFRGRAVRIRTAETLHGWWTLWARELMALN
jgi:hypothetical protein